MVGPEPREEQGLREACGHDKRGDELPFPVAGRLQPLDLARGGHEVAGVAPVTLSSPGRGELPMAAGFQVFGHLLLEDLLKDGLNALSDSRLHVAL